MYCGVITHVAGKDRFGKCVQCISGQCSKAFHLTCARAAGLKIEVGAGALRLHITCNRHADGMRKVCTLCLEYLLPLKSHGL